MPGLGELVLGTVVTLPEPSVRGADLTRRAELRLELADPLAFEEIWQRFVAPATTLLCLCFDRDTHVDSLQLCTGPDEPWLQVRHPMVNANPPHPADHLASREVLFPRETATLGNVARWLVQAPVLSPIPGMVAVRTHSREPAPRARQRRRGAAPTPPRPSPGDH